MSTNLSETNKEILELSIEVLNIRKAIEDKSKDQASINKRLENVKGKIQQVSDKHKNSNDADIKKKVSNLTDDLEILELQVEIFNIGHAIQNRLQNQASINKRLEAVKRKIRTASSKHKRSNDAIKKMLSNLTKVMLPAVERKSLEQQLEYALDGIAQKKREIERRGDYDKNKDWKNLIKIEEKLKQTKQELESFEAGRQLQSNKVVFTKKHLEKFQKKFKSIAGNYRRYFGKSKTVNNDNLWSLCKQGEDYRMGQETLKLRQKPLPPFPPRSNNVNIPDEALISFVLSRITPFPDFLKVPPPPEKTTYNKLKQKIQEDIASLDTPDKKNWYAFQAGIAIPVKLDTQSFEEYYNDIINNINNKFGVEKNMEVQNNQTELMFEPVSKQLASANSLVTDIDSTLNKVASELDSVKDDDPRRKEVMEAYLRELKILLNNTKVDLQNLSTIAKSAKNGTMPADKAVTTFHNCTKAIQRSQEELIRIKTIASALVPAVAIVELGNKVQRDEYKKQVPFLQAKEQLKKTIINAIQELENKQEKSKFGYWSKEKAFEQKFIQEKKRRLEVLLNKCDWEINLKTSNKIDNIKKECELLSKENAPNRLEMTQFLLNQIQGSGEAIGDVNLGKKLVELKKRLEDLETNIKKTNHQKVTGLTFAMQLQRADAEYQQLKQIMIEIGEIEKQASLKLSDKKRKK